jgi:hypothetical protein
VSELIRYRIDEDRSTHFFTLLRATLGFAAIGIDDRYTCDLVGHM